MLLIDDDPAVGLTLSRILAACGHVVEVAESAVDGLAAARTTPPDAILLDIRMPTVGGLEFLRWLRADDRFAALPVAIITGDYFLKDQALADIRGLRASVWYKPLGFDDLEKVMATLLSPPQTAAPPVEM